MFRNDEEHYYHTIIILTSIQIMNDILEFLLNIIIIN